MKEKKRLDSIKQKLSRYWNDPVLSKVIAALIVTLILTIGAKIMNYDFEKFFTNLSTFLSTKINISYFTILLIATLNIFFLWQFKNYFLKNIFTKKESKRASTEELINATTTIGSNNFCEEDQKVEALISNEFPPIDRSNLYYCLANVYDGQKAENIFKSSIGKKYKIDIEGTYEIMGKWDLLIKFRYSGRTQMKKIIQQFEKELGRKNILYQNSSTSSIDSTNKIAWYDVTQEINPFKNKIRQILLHTTENYLKTRSQRGFMFIELHREQKNGFIEQLTTHIKKHQKIYSIIESISICRNDVVINFFMRCSQTSILILLNNSIEEFLQDRELNVVKHTFLCFTFNETPVSNLN